MTRIGLNKAFGAPVKQPKREMKYATEGDNIVLRINRYEFNKISQGLRALLELTKQRRRELSPDDVRYKSYGHDICEIGLLLSDLRKQFNSK